MTWAEAARNTENEDDHPNRAKPGDPYGTVCSGTGSHCLAQLAHRMSIARASRYRLARAPSSACRVTMTTDAVDQELLDPVAIRGGMPRRIGGLPVRPSKST
jgi:hypothetical protein